MLEILTLIYQFRLSVNLRQSLDLPFDSSVSVLKKLGVKFSAISDHGDTTYQP
jgi:hypothetical protein